MPKHLRSQAARPHNGAQALAEPPAPASPQLPAPAETAIEAPSSLEEPLAPDFEASPALPSNPILYRPAETALRQAHGPDGPPMRSAGGFVSILSQRLPEPTSYSGKNIIALEFPEFEDAMFKEQTNRANLLEFDGKSTYVDCGNPQHLQGGGAAGLTIEAWIRADNRDGEYQQIVSHGQEHRNNKYGEVFLRLNNGRFEFGTWDGTAVYSVCNEATRVRNEDLKNWVHLAGVYDHTIGTYFLYRNGICISWNKAAKGPLAVDNPWYIGGMWDESTSNKRMVRFFKGFVAEVRIWTVARKEDEIRRYMVDSLPPSALDQLGAYWRLNEGNGTKAMDSSRRESHGTIKGTTAWKLATTPIGELSRLLQRQPDNKVDSAFRLAKDTGFFDPLVFPRIRGLMTQPERKRVREAIGSLDLETFKAFYSSGYHLTLRRGFSGAPEYAFVQNPPPGVKPKLMLVEEYRLSSFLGNYGVGRTLKSFSLLPGERTKLTIKTSSTSTTTTKQAQSILDSYSRESASEFESSLSDEKSNRSSTSEEMGYYASVEGGASWGFGSCSAKAGANGSSNSAREEFAKSVSTATSKHAAKASANRNVQINTSSETTVTQTQDNEIVREIENINVGRTLNFVFCQMNQEIVSLLHLVDLRVGYSDGVEPMRESPLYELPELLNRVMVEDETKRKTVRDWIYNEVKKIRNHEGKEVNKEAKEEDRFVVEVQDAVGDGKRFAVNRRCASEFEEPSTRTKAKAPGIIVSSQTIVMRTEDVAVDALIGQGSALDTYAERLQEEENRRKQLANDATWLQNQLLEAELKQKNVLVRLMESKEVETLAACADALRMAPAGNPSRVVSVWEPKAMAANTNGHGTAV